MSDDISAILFLALFGGLAFVIIAWTRRRAGELLAGWAAAGGYRLQHAEMRFFRCGPYFWRHSRSQLIYYVQVIDAQGRPRSGYLRLGGWVLGLLSDQIDVTWDA